MFFELLWRVWFGNYGLLKLSRAKYVNIRISQYPNVHETSATLSTTELILDDECWIL